MSATLLPGSRLAAAHRSSTCVDPTTSFLSTLHDFLTLLSADHPHTIGQLHSSDITPVLRARHFQLAQVIERNQAVMAVCGHTWTQGLMAIFELARCSQQWAIERGVDPCDDQLMTLWQDAIGLAFYAEVTARTHLLPAPYSSWQAGMLLSAVAISEQLRLLEDDEGYGSAQVSLGAATMRQLENLVIQNDFFRSLQPSAAQRISGRLGPWPCVALAFRVCEHMRPMAWAARFFERFECLAMPIVLEQCLASQFRQLWPEYVEIASLTWRFAMNSRNDPAGSTSHKSHLSR